MESITGFIKAFCEKMWFWLIVSVFSLIALFSEETFQWLGFEARNRWIVGVVVILALSLSIQHICDWVKEYVRQRSIIKNIDNLTDSALDELKNIVNKRKKTLKLKDKNNIEQKRIITHFNLERHDDYVTFPDFLWKELEKKFVKETDKSPIICNTNNKNRAKKIFCSKMTWIAIAILVIAINPRAIITQYISEDWYLWFMLIFTAFLVWVIFKVSHNCKKVSIEDIVYMGAIYSLGLFVCLSSPISNSYPEKDIQRLFDCLTAFGPLIVGFVAAFFACTQWKVVEKQHNLDLFKERWKIKTQLEEYIPELTNISGESCNYVIIYQKLTKIIDVCSYLYNVEIAKKAEEIANLYLKTSTLSRKNTHLIKTKQKVDNKAINKEYNNMLKLQTDLQNLMEMISAYLKKNNFQ